MVEFRLPGKKLAEKPPSKPAEDKEKADYVVETEEARSPVAKEKVQETGKK